MKIIKKIIFCIICVGLSIGILLFAQGYKMYQEAIEQMPLQEKIAKLEEKEEYIEKENLPKEYLTAVVSVEDHRFYQHGGIDIIAIGRATLHNIQKRRIVEGGSTITQQLAKNLYFTQEQTITRKIAEVFMAWKIEKECTKDKILELYVNDNYFGDGYYGIGEATKGYLKKTPMEMTKEECALLAGIPNAPSIYAPTKNPELAKQRKNQVMKKVKEYGQEISSNICANIE